MSQLGLLYSAWPHGLPRLQCACMRRLQSAPPMTLLTRPAGVHGAAVDHGRPRGTHLPAGTAARACVPQCIFAPLATASTASQHPAGRHTPSWLLVSLDALKLCLHLPLCCLLQGRAFLVGDAAHAFPPSGELVAVGCHKCFHLQVCIPACMSVPPLLHQRRQPCFNMLAAFAGPSSLPSASPPPARLPALQAHLA